MSEDLKRRIDKLTLEEKLQVRDFVMQSIEDTTKITHSSLRASILLGEMGNIYGKVISYTNRDAWCVWARTMVAYQMTLEGYSLGEIGRQLMKDHSTIIHLRNKMQDALDMPQAYKDIIPIWETFQKRIKQ